MNHTGPKEPQEAGKEGGSHSRSKMILRPSTIARGALRCTAAASHRHYNNSPSRVFGRYMVFKSSACLDLGSIPPSYKTAGADAIAVDRQGVLLLGFTPSNGDGQKGYAWQQKQLFSLSATECGEMMTLGAAAARPELAFHHDPGMGTPDEGANSKELTLTPIPDGSGQDGGGYFFSLAAGDVGNRITVPVSVAELAVLRTLLQYSIPHMLGWDAMMNPGLVSMDSIGGGGAFRQGGTGGGGGGEKPQFHQGNTEGGDWPF